MRGTNDAPCEGTERDAVDGGLLLEHHRVELTRFCRHMLRSASDADDAAQETLVRAWQGLDRLASQRAIRSWLYSIATNVCLDAFRRRQRHAVPMDLSLAAMPAAAVPTTGGDPGEVVVSRESVRLALIAAVSNLPRRQRAVLILRDVLGWRAAEVADLLGSSVVAVNSTLQRARVSIAQRALGTDAAAERLDDERGALLADYVDAFERCDVDALADRLRRDAYFASGRAQSRPRRARLVNAVAREETGPMIA